MSNNQISSLLINENTSTSKTLKRSGDYFKQTSSKYSKSLNGIKTVKRKFKKRKHYLSMKNDYLTDEASESSFDSSLIDCFNGLATYSDSDDYIVLNKLRKSSTNVDYKSNATTCKSQKYFKRYLIHSSASSTSKSYQKRSNRKPKQKFVLVSSRCLNSSTKKKRENFNKDEVMHDVDEEEEYTDKMSTNDSYSSNDTENDQSSLTENENNHEADDEQSDWPVNEPSLIQSLNKINNSSLQVLNDSCLNKNNILINKYLVSCYLKRSQVLNHFKFL
jgi:hypothetical protein